jgi:hypothetical protein
MARMRNKSAKSTKSSTPATVADVGRSGSREGQGIGPIVVYRSRFHSASAFAP